VATSPVPRAEFETRQPAGATTTREPGTRQVFSGGEWIDAAVHRADQLHDGLGIDGLAIVELHDTTVVIGPDQYAAVDGFGNIVIQNHR
jgi:N-methylhydantoinase A